MNNRKILTASLIASLAFHVIAIVFFQRYSFWFSSPHKFGDQAQVLSLVDKKERDQILKVAFEKIDFSEEKTPLTPEQEEIAPFRVQPPLHLKENETSLLFSSPFSLPFNDFLAAKPIFPTFSVPLESLNLLEHLPNSLIVPIPNKPSAAALHPYPTRPDLQLFAKTPLIKNEAPIAPFSYPDAGPTALTGDPITAKAPSMIPIPDLPKLPTLADLETSSYSDSFDADLTFLPKEDGSGYVFALTLIPQPNIELPRIRQHFIFLIDRSNSIQQGRLSATKAAVHKALGELNPEDTFNIVAFDSKVDKMSPNFLPCTTKSFAIAEEFLEKIQLGSFFSTSDLYKPLFMTVPHHVENDEVYTAILLTDAESFAKKQTQRSVLQDWTRYNSGKVMLYALAMNSDLHAATLDTAAAFNKGKLILSPTNRGLKRKLLKLIKTVQNPIAKNIACKAISHSPQSKIYLFPQVSQMAQLYVDQPFVILGETDTLDDFILFVQGRLKNRWLNIKKTISFLNAKKGGKSLRQEWAVQRAYNLYENYLLDNNSQHIAEAQTLLQPFDHQAAFQ